MDDLNGRMMDFTEMSLRDQEELLNGWAYYPPFKGQGNQMEMIGSQVFVWNAECQDWCLVKPNYP